MQDRPVHREDNYTRAYFVNGDRFAVVGSCEQRTVRVFETDSGAQLRDVDVGHAVEVGDAENGTSTLCNYSYPNDQTIYVQSLRGHPSREFCFMALIKSYYPPSLYYMVEVDLMKREAWHERNELYI